MADIFFPSCKAKVSYPEASRKLAAYIKERFGTDPIGCCKQNNQKLTKNDRAVILCLNCARVIEKQAVYGSMVFVWELIDQDESFSFPDYGGEHMTVQDCRIGKGHDEAGAAVRSLMGKMNITTEELDGSCDQKNFCAGADILLGGNQKTKLSRTGQEEFFHNRYDSVPTDKIVSYCKFCNDGVNMSAKTGKHILELLFPE